MKVEFNWDFLKITPMQWLYSVACIVLSAVFMPFFMFSANAEEAKIVDILLPVAIFVSIGLIVFIVLAAIFRNVQKAAICAVIAVLMLENYTVIENLLQTLFAGLRYWHTLPICIVVCLHLFYVVYRLIKPEIADMITMVATIAFGALILVNIVTAVPKIISVAADSKVTQNDSLDLSTDDSIESGERANIYFFLLDEAASFHTLQEHYNYDASEFKAFLNSNNFCVSDHAYNEIYEGSGPRTVVTLTNLINLDYVAEYEWSAEKLSAYRNNSSALFSILNKYDYTTRGTGDTQWLNVRSQTSDNADSSAKTIDGVDLEQIIMGQTFLYPFFTMDVSGYQKNILDALNYYLGDVYNVDRTFNLTYICSPHQPFVFDENGNSVNSAFQNDVANESVYLGQYKYMMTKMTEVISSIIENDPDSIIVLASDHGPRFNSKMKFSEKSNILSAVYYKGEDISEVKDQSLVNIMRIIFSRMFNEDLPIVEVPNEVEE